MATVGVRGFRGWKQGDWVCQQPSESWKWARRQANSSEYNPPPHLFPPSSRTLSLSDFVSVCDRVRSVSAVLDLGNVPYCVVRCHAVLRTDRRCGSLHLRQETHVDRLQRVRYTPRRCISDDRLYDWMGTDGRVHTPSAEWPRQSALLVQRSRDSDTGNMLYGLRKAYADLLMTYYAI